VIKKPRNEEAKARYRAVKIQPQWVVTPGKQPNKHLADGVLYSKKNFMKHFISISSADY
jgi:hypothetical protein